MEFVHYPDYQKIPLSWIQVEKYIDLMIQSDRYLTDAEKEQRIIRQEAERQLPMLDGTVAAEYTALKEQYPNTLVGFELNGNYLFYDKDAVAVERILHTNLLSQENTLGKVKVTGFPSEQWAAESKKLWAEGNNVYLAGLNEDGSHHQTKYLRESDYLPIGSIVKLDDRDFRVEHVNFMFKSVSLQDMELTKNRLPIFRNEHLPHIRELYEEQQDAAIELVPEKEVSYKVGDEVVVDLPTRTIEGTIGYIGDTDVRIDTSAHGQSWDNEVINKQQFENALRQEEQDEPELSDEELDKLPISAVLMARCRLSRMPPPWMNPLMQSLFLNPPGTSASQMSIWARAAQSKSTPETSKPSELCSVWRRSTVVPPLRNSGCFPSM